MLVEDYAAPLAVIVLTDDMHDGPRNLTVNEPPSESLSPARGLPALSAWIAR